MKFVDHNFVSDEEAKNIMESYGYEGEESVVEESADKVELVEGAFVIERDGHVFALTEDVEEIEDTLFIEVIEIDEESGLTLDESSTTLMESVDFDEVTYGLGDIFEDEETGETFVQLSKEN